MRPHRRRHPCHHLPTRDWVRPRRPGSRYVASPLLWILENYTNAGIGSIAAGWQASLGSVAAGSLFAVLQTMAMTGVFTGIGALLIAGGLLKSIGKGFWSFMTRVSDYGRYLVDATVRLLLGEGRA